VSDSVEKRFKTGDDDDGYLEAYQTHIVESVHVTVVYVMRLLVCRFN
jgi:hypothetical protein